jgi:peptidoglycan/xylan/chitin deacetylase (PgdA/CDA1 family)
VRLTAETGLDWISDTYDDDLPYWAEIGDRDQLVIPYTLEANDMRFATAPGYITGAGLRPVSDRQLRHAHAEGGRMFSVGLHCRLIGRPGKIAGLIRFLDHVAAKGGAWFATRSQIADHWAAHHPHTRRERPSPDGPRPFRRPLRRHLRTLPLDRRTRLGPRTRPRP